MFENADIMCRDSFWPWTPNDMRAHKAWAMFYAGKEPTNEETQW